MPATRTVEESGNAIAEAAIVAAWVVATYFILRPVFDSTVTLNLGSIWTWFGIAAAGFGYPVWTMLVIAMVGGYVRRMVDRRRGR
ncbi:MAG: hypothetical protein GY791_17455 [Alphaproteobacteria bacterium]|nr:hypothetical protein [Alphaproteobacteria bacterium]